MVAAAYQNPSFEIAGGNAATILSGGAEPYALVDNANLTLVVNEGIEQDLRFEIGTQSTILAALVGLYPLADGQTLDIEVDGAPAVTVTFLAGDFDDITQASAAEVAAVIQGAVGGIQAENDGGAVRLTSATKGSSSLVDVSGGTAAAAFGFPAGVAGVQFFADITAATAAEIVARIDAQAVGFSAAVDTGRVRLTLAATGSDQCITITGGAANTALLYDLTQVCGLTNPGQSQGWTVTTLSSVWELVTFSTGLDFPSAHETFTLGWADSDVFEIGDLALAVFDGPAFEETFDSWAALIDELPSTIAASFNAALTVTVVEGFDQGWPTIPGSEQDVFELGVLTDAVFGSLLVPPAPTTDETFDLGWLGNEDDVSTLPPLTDLVFGQGGTAETFAPFNPVHTEVQVFAATIGNGYQISVNGLQATVNATTASPNDVAAALASGVDGLPLAVGAVAVGDRVQITNEATNTEDFVVGVNGTDPTQIAKVFDGAVQPDVQWGGADANQCL